MADLIKYDITEEQWREYEFGPMDNRITYRINVPQTLYCRPGGTTHRVVDANGIAHCLPAPGLQGCVLRWYSPELPVKF